MTNCRPYAFTTDTVSDFHGISDETHISYQGVRLLLPPLMLLVLEASRAVGPNENRKAPRISKRF